MSQASSDKRSTVSPPTPPSHHATRPAAKTVIRTYRTSYINDKSAGDYFFPMPRLSRGCLRCRQRRVRCDESRPSCKRCINRSEVCEGYRDESSLIFQHETEKVIGLAHARASQPFLPSTSSEAHASARKRSKSVDATSRPVFSLPGQDMNLDPSELAPGEAAGIRLRNLRPWLKEMPPEMMPSVEEQAVDSFMDKYVMYPCNQTSSPGFLEHLPLMFQEVNVNGRYALRWAVRAAAYADLSRDQDGDALARKALECYGVALSALGDSLDTPGKVPDDYDLMTVVVLDIFEASLSAGMPHPPLIFIDFIYSQGSRKGIACPRNGADSQIARSRLGLQLARLEPFPTRPSQDREQSGFPFSFSC